MPTWFRLTVWLGSAEICLLATAKLELGPIAGGLLMLLNIAVGASAVAIGRSDRHASHADDPATLNLHR